MASQTISAQEFLPQAQGQLHRLERARGDLAAARAEHDARARELDAARARALDELTAACLPDLSREAIDRVKTETRYGRFAREDPLSEIARRRDRLEARLREIDADDRYARRDALLDPVAGELTLEVERLDHDLEQLLGPLERYESDPYFRRLIGTGYDTETYAVSRWKLQYYRDWKWGDVFCERFGQRTFAEVREAYFNLQRASVAVRLDLERARRRVEEVRRLVAEREETTAKLRTLVGDTLASCRAMLREHLEHVDRADLATWLAADPTRVALVKRLDGIERKRAYLDDLAARQFGSEDEALSRAAAKLRRKLDKFQRQKHAYDRIPSAEAEAWLADPTPKLAERRQRFRRDYDTVYEFERYDAFDYARDVLWWDLMTDGRVDGDFVPEADARRPGGADLARAGNAYSPGGDWRSGDQEVS
jgi:hypothetical protein